MTTSNRIYISTIVNKIDLVIITLRYILLYSSMICFIGGTFTTWTLHEHIERHAEHSEILISLNFCDYLFAFNEHADEESPYSPGAFTVIFAWTLLVSYFIILLLNAIFRSHIKYANRIKSIIKPIIIFNFLELSFHLLYILFNAEKSLSWASHPLIGSGIIFMILVYVFISAYTFGIPYRIQQRI